MSGSVHACGTQLARSSLFDELAAVSHAANVDEGV